MRYLNKLTFIHSAGIQYAELQVDGNVHLIGTQGVGKSTLLRAILFFYNADTQKLGIGREKKSFAEYYFPFQNSYIIYEVAREIGPYCILAFKSQGRVCFRFLDTAYDKAIFIRDDGSAHEQWEDSRQVLDARQVLYTRKIDRYEEYRDILYGNTDTAQRDTARYYILKSRQYQNIPRTIQNVFLNSKLDAEFIKQTIIMSLNEEDLAIDLEQYDHHLKNFDTQLQDIQRFRQPAVTKIADQVIDAYHAIRHIEKERNRTASTLAATAARASQDIPGLEHRLARGQQAEADIRQRIASRTARYQERADGLKREMHILEDKLDQLSKKEAHYAKLKIGEILEEVGTKAQKERQQQALRKELEVLNSKFGSVTHKYEALLAAHDNGITAQLQSIDRVLLQRREELMEREKMAREDERNELDSIRNSFDTARLKLEPQFDAAAQVLNAARMKRTEIHHTRFREAELKASEDRSSALKISIHKAELELSQAEEREASVRKQWSFDEAGAKQEADRNIRRIQEKIDQNSSRLAMISEQLAASSDAFYGWLQANLPGWEQTIGKVLDEQILFRQDLSPRINETRSSLYGVSLDLTGLPTRIRSLEEYENERRSIVQTQEALARERQDEELLQAEVLQKLKTKHGGKLRELTDSLRETRYRHDSDKAALIQEAEQFKELEQLAANEKQQAFASCDVAVSAAEDKLAYLRQLLLQAELGVKEKLQARKAETDKHIGAFRQELHGADERTREARSQLETDAQDRRSRIVAARDKELNQEGADTGRISALEAALTTVAAALGFIEQHRDTVAEYLKDRRELIDKRDDFTAALTRLQDNLDAETQCYRQQRELDENDAKAAKTAVEILQEQLRRAVDDKDAFKTFSLSPAWESIEEQCGQASNGLPTDRTCRQLIDELNLSIGRLNQQWDRLKESGNRFLGNFSAGNIFSFPVQLINSGNYLGFAADLQDFRAEDKIAEYEKRVNERFAHIIHSVDKETGALMSKSHDIQKIINDINRDFESKNFVTAIQKIELRVDESTNTIVRLLSQIRKFREEHVNELGSLNLFSPANHEATNRKAVDLLKQLAKGISEQKTEAVTLSDTFELLFRIEENHNSSGWVEKLSNVGSEGTDVLVKAMINIMLLNVFKESASKKFKDFRLHCMMDEIGKLHPSNVKGILQFANDRNINLVNGSPIENNALDYRHIYRLERDSQRHTRVRRIITNHAVS